MERSCSERDLSSLSHSGKKRNQSMNEARSEAQLFNNTLPDVNNTPRKFTTDVMASLCFTCLSVVLVGGRQIKRRL